MSRLNSIKNFSLNIQQRTKLKYVQPVFPTACHIRPIFVSNFSRKLKQWNDFLEKRMRAWYFKGAFAAYRQFPTPLCSYSLNYFRLQATDGKLNKRKGYSNILNQVPKAKNIMDLIFWAILRYIILTVRFDVPLSILRNFIPLFLFLFNCEIKNTM